MNQKISDQEFCEAVMNFAEQYNVACTVVTKTRTAIMRQSGFKNIIDNTDDQIKKINPTFRDLKNRLEKCINGRMGFYRPKGLNIAFHVDLIRDNIDIYLGGEFYEVRILTYSFRGSMIYVVPYSGGKELLNAAEVISADDYVSRDDYLKILTSAGDWKCDDVASLLTKFLRKEM